MHRPQHAASPRPRSPARLTPGRQRRNKGAGEDGSRCRQSSSPAAAGVRNAPARPIVWGPLCSSTCPVPSRTGRNIGRGTEMALLKEALACEKPPAFAPPYVPVWHAGPRSLCPRGQVGSPPRRPEHPREPGAAEQRRRTDPGFGATRQPAPECCCSPGALTLRRLWEVGSGRLALPRGAGGLPSPHAADAGPGSPARLR